MANEFPKLAEVFKIGTEVTYDEAIEKVFLPQDNAVKSIPTISPIETLALTENKIVPTAFLVQIQIVENLSNELHLIDYTNLRDGATLQLRILDNNNPIVIKNGISGNGSIMTADGNDIELNDYRTIVQLQLEGTLWRQVGGIQAQADWNQVDSKKPDFIKNKPTNLLDSTNIANCITEIPQDIKLELNNGDLTLKAGSKVWVPYGTSDVYNIGDVDSFGNTVVDKSFSDGKFFYAITTSVDTSTRADSINAYIVVYNTVEKRMDYWGWDGTTSFDGYNTTDGMHYNISENNIRIRVNGGIYGDNFSLPICVVSKNTTAVTGLTSIDQVFNGLGYIGSTIFALPVIKGLIPNGRNEDGSLKNIEFVNDVVRTRYLESNQTYTNAIFALATTGIGVYYYTYDAKENYLLSGSAKLLDRFDCGLMSSTNGAITSFSPKTTFRAVDYNDMPTITYWD